MQQKLVCPSCNADVPADNINVAQMLAVCPNCDTVFNFGSLSAAQKSKQKKKPRKMHPPQGFHVETTPEGFSMRWRWFTPAIIGATFFAIVWNAFLVFWYNMLGDFSMDGGFLWIFYIFPIGHIAVGIGMAYYALTGWLNTTTARVSEELLEVRSAPIPNFFGDGVMACSDIQQVYVNSRTTRNGIVYDVVAKRYGAYEKAVVKGIRQKDFAHYIEQEVEAFLGVENQKVEGELQR